MHLTHTRHNGPALLRFFLACSLLSTAALAGAAVPATCTAIEDPAARLSCYDARFRSPASAAQAPASAESPAVVVAPPRPMDAAAHAEVAPPAERRGEPCDSRFDAARPVIRSPLAWRWDLDRCEKTRSVLLPHRPNYLLPVAFDRTLNVDSYSEQNADGEGDNGSFKHAEAKFQLSFKLRMMKDIFWGNGDLWGAYTQRSFWQVYSRKVSSPFRESNYEPELILSFRTPFELGPVHGRYVNIAFNHQSNGRSDELSRSWNRVYLEAGFDGDNYMAYIRPWWRISDNGKKDDNPGIENWMGRVEMVGAWQWQKHVFSATLRNNLLWDNNRGSLQLGWTYPLTDRIKSYVQYFNGYGESLIDYQHPSNGIGVGIMLGDWL